MRIQTDLNKLVFRNDQEVIEVFCKQKYKNYYVRGQIHKFSDNIYDKELEEGCAYGYYLVKIFFLANNDFFSSTTDESWYIKSEGKTINEYLKIKRDYAIKIAKKLEIKNPLSKIFSSYNSPMLIDIKDIDIQDDSFLKDSIINKKDAIPLSIDFELLNVKSSQNKKIISYPNRIYNLVAYHYADDNDHYESEVRAELNFYDLFYYDFDYEYGHPKEFISILTYIGNVASDWLKNKNVSEDMISALNDLSKNAIRNHPLYDFCYKFLDNLITDLKDNKKIGQCESCGKVFKYVKGKKYCSKDDGTNCGKKMRNKRFYQKHRDEILPKARKSTKDYRDYYKKIGVKK